jgi:hypothetical protein
MSINTKRVYGISTELYIVSKPNTDAFVVGGQAEDLSRWTRVLSTRAAFMLWFHIARLLMPEHIEQVTTVFNTTPLRSAVLPTITNHCMVEPVNKAYVEITGWAGEQSWVVHVTNEEATEFWSALDKLLFPQGWQSA